MLPVGKRAGPARRLVLAWDGAVWRVRRDVRIAAKRVLVSSRLPKTGAAGLTGFWWEVVDSSGNVRYRRVVADPCLQSVELRQPDGGFTNVRVRRSSARLDATFEDHPDVHSIRVYGQQRSPDDRAPAAELLAVIRLRPRSEDSGDVR